MKASELRSKAPDEVKKYLNDLQQEQFRLRMGKATGQLTHTHRLSEIRRAIARARTVMAQRGE